MKSIILACLCALTALSSTAAAAEPERPLDLGREDVQAFIADVSSRHNLDPDLVRDILEQARVQPRIIEAISRPAEKVKPWYEYRRIFLTEERISAGETFWTEHREILERVSAESGVPAEIIAGIIGVETFYGRIMGRFRVLDALATLAFEYPPRSRFFTGELEQFFLLVGEQGFDPTGPVGSYAGAMGFGQFIPSSYRAYARDGDGDGRVDLWNIEDAVASVGNYLAVHGWLPGQPVVAPAVVPGGAAEGLADQGLKPSTTAGALWDAGIGLAGPGPARRQAAAGLFVLDGEDGPLYWSGFANFYVITRYNRSLMYALAVTQLGESVRARVLGDDGA